MIIAVDGPAGAGKGTLARGLARALGFAYLDTGLLYRAVGALAGHAEDTADFGRLAAQAAAAVTAADLERTDLRSEAAGRLASKVAAMPAVREALLDFQRGFAHSPPDGKPGAVVDGRDIGTVVCPDAEVKLFVTASAEERARRRHKELLERGEGSIYARVLEQMQARDSRDSEREVAPLQMAGDAIVLDTTEMAVDAALQAALRIVAARQAGIGR